MVLSFSPCHGNSSDSRWIRDTPESYKGYQEVDVGSHVSPRPLLPSLPVRATCHTCLARETNLMINTWADQRWMSLNLCKGYGKKMQCRHAKQFNLGRTSVLFRFVSVFPVAVTHHLAAIIHVNNEIIDIQRGPWLCHWWVVDCKWQCGDGSSFLSIGSFDIHGWWLRTLRWNAWAQLN